MLIKPAKHYRCQARVTHALAELADLSATVADMAGFSLSYTQFGKSLLHLISKEEVHKDAVFCEGGRIHGEKQCMELGHGPESPYYPRLSTQYEEGPQHTKAVMIRQGNFKYTKRLYESDEFYDLSKDQMELNNQINNPVYQGEIKSMRDRLLDFYQETTDFVPNRRDKR
ncbi:hypothetical protein SDC9_176094 [bioreactor metagenome]|uniref:N-sulphoglucosamine sulphohydrolase C-terminal domain-containing protein n=1 Tax=bioreactor metagenome TaxID=1076179 RepID=A0A645GP11_9ZZZZ